ncbi:potassium/proton antiporter [Brachyspira hampsonii]|uniref:potassium/proton antiporter n=1 Tax=Brachyspira hampsonii TaxID=1287055 RepID=UPI000D34D4A5|nr:potassium/proton antiporter [Brachyspira hampsonii]PTY40039.1 potassium transporter [Brachyspira hampsonii bv. II]
MNISILLSSIIIILCIIMSKISTKVGVPSLLLFLFLGMIFGTDGLLKMEFDDYRFAEQLCTITLIFIMFYGGFGTNWKAAKPVANKAFLLSFIGTFITSMITGALCHYVLKFNFFESFLIGSVIGSTDAASVFSILRSRNLNLKDGLASLLELESGSNDPMSYMLTVIFLGLIGRTLTSPLSILYMVFAQIVFALIVAALVSFLAYNMLRKFKFPVNGLDTIFTLAVALLSYSLSSTIGGNGYLTVYIVGIVLGNSKIKNKVTLVHFFDGVTGLMQMVLFFLLGLLSFPSRIFNVAPTAIYVALFVTFVARPIAVFSILTPFKVSLKKQILVMWAGLRGAASIVFAIFVIVNDNSISYDIFHVVFVLAILSVLLQGTLLPFIAKKLDLVDSGENVLKTFNDYVDDSDMELIQVKIPNNHHWIGRPIMEIELPEDSIVVTIEREGDTIIPHGNTVIEKGDIVVLNAKRTKYYDMSLREVNINSNHPWKNKELKDLNLPKNNLVVMIKREGGSVIPRGNTVIKDKDIVLIKDV